MIEKIVCNIEARITKNMLGDHVPCIFITIFHIYFLNLAVCMILIVVSSHDRYLSSSRERTKDNLSL